MKDKITKFLRRKFQVLSCETSGKTVNLEFNLMNFRNFNIQKLEVRIDNKKVPIKVNNTRKSRYILQFNEILLKENTHTIDIYYKNKKLWITNGIDNQNVIIANNQLYTFMIDKSIEFSKYNTNYRISNEIKHVSIKEIDDQLIAIDTDQNVQSVILINQYKSKEIAITDNHMNKKDLQEAMDIEMYKVLIVRESTIFEVKFNHYYIDYYLTMKYEWQNDSLKIGLNSIEIDALFMNSILNSKNIKLRMIPSEDLSKPITFDKENKQYFFESLGLIDNALNEFQLIQTNLSDNSVTANLSSHLFSTPQPQKLFAQFKDCKTGEKLLCVINSKMKVSFKDFYMVEDEIYQLNVIRKNGVTFKSKKPKNRLGIHNINQEKMCLYYQPHPIYSSFKHYMTFEERGSGCTFDIKLNRGEQDIIIPYHEFEKLRTARKNIIDVFVTIYDGQKLIRKEKIRYRNVDYKKDEVLTLKEIENNIGKAYYMATITPFKNIKFESFEMSNEEKRILDNGRLDNNIWLIGERTDTAQDNGIVLFKWLRSHTDVEAYYVIDEEASDYQKIKHLDYVITFGSRAHFEVISKAKVLLSTHDLENIVPYKTAAPFWHYKDTTKVFLQHGVLGRKNVEYHKEYYHMPFDLFNVSSTKEKRDIVMNQLGYEDREVAITGLSRFDNLPLTPQKEIRKILLMPTWRDWLNSDFIFESSTYLQQYMKLINDKSLIDYLKAHHIEFNFYPHYRSQAFFKKFGTDINPYVNFIELGEQTVQDLLIEHDILITDYSSVSFDFSYMQKPVIFYHFDVNRFFRKGILRPVKETFIGDITYTNNEIINSIKRIVENGYEFNNSAFKEVFDRIDHQNNQRVYDEIIKRLEIKS